MTEDSIPITLSLIVPVYNEHLAIEKSIEEISKIMGSWSETWEVILVDDGSTDGTQEKLRNLNLSGSYRLITHKTNKGYGAALKTGTRAARGKWVAITDCDLTYPLDRLPDLFEKAQAGALMVVGSRTGENVHLPLMRRFPKWVLKQLASYLAGFKIPDLNSGFRVFLRSSLLPHLALLPNGFSFTTTITLVHLTRGDDVEYVPVDYSHRVGSSKIRPIRDTLLFFQLIVRTVTLFQPLKVYVPLALLCEVIAGAIVWLHLDWGRRIPDATVAIFAMTGVMLFCIGLLADLVSRRIGHLHELLLHDRDN